MGKRGCGDESNIPDPLIGLIPFSARRLVLDTSCFKKQIDGQATSLHPAGGISFSRQECDSQI